MSFTSTRISSNLWDAWDVDVFYKEKSETLDGIDELSVIESGPLRATVRVERTFGKSRLEQDIILRAGIRPASTFPRGLNWQESQKMLKVAFPVDIHRRGPLRDPVRSIRAPNAYEHELGSGAFRGLRPEVG